MGRFKQLADVAHRRVVREDFKGILSSSGLIKALQLQVKPRSIRQVLQSGSHFRYKRIMWNLAMK